MIKLQVNINSVTVHVQRSGFLLGGGGGGGGGEREGAFATP